MILLFSPFLTSIGIGSTRHSGVRRRRREDEKWLRVTWRLLCRLWERQGRKHGFLRRLQRMWVVNMFGLYRRIRSTVWWLIGRLGGCREDRAWESTRKVAEKAVWVPRTAVKLRETLSPKRIRRFTRLWSRLGRLRWLIRRLRKLLGRYYIRRHSGLLTRLGRSCSQLGRLLQRRVKGVRS